MTLIPVFLHSWGDLLPHFDEVLHSVEGQLNIISFQTNQMIWLQSEEMVFMSSREKNTTLERENKGRMSQRYINEVKSWQLQSNLFNSARGTNNATRVLEEEAGTSHESPSSVLPHGYQTCPPPSHLMRRADPA